jgi:hypothetical protein
MQFLEAIAELNRLKRQIQDLTSRTFGLQVGIVCDNSDPLNQRRIKVTPQSKAGLATTDWLAHCNPSPAMDAPIPLVGSTVYFQFLDGDPHDGVWIGITHNDTNPSDPTQSDPVNDCAVEIPGNDRRTVVGEATYQVTGNRDDEVEGNLTVDVGGNLAISTRFGEIDLSAQENQITIKGQSQVRIEDGSGGYVVMSGGVLRMGNSAGQEWVMGGSSGNQWQWNAAGSAIAIVNASDVTINGKSVIVVGSTDTDGDINNNRGY